MMSLRYFASKVVPIYCSIICGVLLDAEWVEELTDARIFLFLAKVGVALESGYRGLFGGGSSSVKKDQSIIIQDKIRSVSLALAMVVF